MEPLSIRRQVISIWWQMSCDIRMSIPPEGTMLPWKIPGEGAPGIRCGSGRLISRQIGPCSLGRIQVLFLFRFRALVHDRQIVSRVDGILAYMVHLF